MFSAKHITVRFLVLAASLAALLSLSGCSSDQENWNAKDISGLMPELAYQLTDTSGDMVTAEDSAGNIRLMFFGFTSCPDICPTTLQKLAQAVQKLPEDAQEDMQIIFVSVDPNRDTPERIKSYVDFFSDGIIGLTGEEENLRELSKRYRTTFGYEEPDDKGNYAVSHSGAVYVFDRNGKARLLVRPEQSMDALIADLTALANEGA
ncbi:SCO family protein [Marinobacter confluentis]|uniref:SCO family protein n=1 Tax=Marinobacter confluentis TaxID=1697557 RepID=A0A4Z1C7V7_9GAMM|nr:SCO family protein [Marinobacter confluentis]TGN41730.1 SCO family protein [Marinobacter confluentis]